VRQHTGFNVRVLLRQGQTAAHYRPAEGLAFRFRTGADSYQHLGRASRSSSLSCNTSRKPAVLSLLYFLLFCKSSASLLFVRKTWVPPILGRAGLGRDMFGKWNKAREMLRLRISES
jgi:hypothetical protein